LGAEGPSPSRITRVSRGEVIPKFSIWWMKTIRYKDGLNFDELRDRFTLNPYNYSKGAV